MLNSWLLEFTTISCLTVYMISVQFKLNEISMISSFVYISSS